jgi:hypothetical protein
MWNASQYLRLIAFICLPISTIVGFIFSDALAIIALWLNNSILSSETMWMVRNEYEIFAKYGYFISTSTQIVASSFILLVDRI